MEAAWGERSRTKFWEVVGVSLPCAFTVYSESVIYPVGNWKASLAWFLIREIT